MTAASPVEARHSRYPLERGGALQRKTLWVLSAGTILGGLGVGASLSVGALLLAEVSGSAGISGLASAMFNMGAALAGIPLAKLAAAKGRRRAIVTGNSVAMVGAVTAVYGTSIGVWPVLALGILVLGVASSVQLLARFTATDLALPQNRARDLSLVVWTITIGAVVGPNLMGPGAWIGGVLGINPLAGVFVFTIAAQLLAATVSWFGLRPDPLLTARDLPAEDVSAAGSNAPVAVPISRGGQARVIVLIAMAQAVMVALMAMAPLHIMDTGGTHERVGFTLSLHIAGMYVLSPVFGMLAMKIGRPAVVSIGWAILLVSVGLAFVAHTSPIVMEASMMLLGVGWGAVTVAGATLITELTPVADRTKRQGQSDAIMSGSGAIAGVLAGIAFAVSGYQLIALVCLVLIAVGIIATVAVARESARARAASGADSQKAE
ncbi:MFS transporter [Leucobacter sp. UCMA 4100]|uniref:MFS transporter n=1 Tax=Leucobacter sp. UCMA 4100 TaxID=2810534 RepID=UPI0022EB2294|nr:MFS transporter [Leucobacter sp. UCMA 4100]